MIIAANKPDLPDEYLVDNRVYFDRSTYEAERERIFLKSWNFVCHESEIPNPGDFLTTTAAGQAIIICRNGAGDLRAYYNACRHRAAQVVCEERGHTRNFTCLYHLWSYDLNGRLTGVPEAAAYRTSFNPGGLAMERFGLVAVRIEACHRLVFVCFDSEAPALEDFLGGAAASLKMPFGAPESEVFLVRRSVVNANWKMQPENSRDGYHAPLLHRRLLDVSPPKPYRVLDHGHSVQELGLDYASGLARGTVDKVLRDDPEMTLAFMRHPLPGMSLERPALVVVLFPDTLLLVRYSTALIERQIALGPEQTLIELRACRRIDDSPEVRSIRERHWQLYWSSDGGNLPEDIAAWEAQQRGVHALGVQHSLIARGEPAREGLRGDDNRLRQFWQEWRRLMGTSQNAPLEHEGAL